MNDTEKNEFLDETTMLESQLHGVVAGKSEVEPYLIILSGQDKGKQYRLFRQNNTFGRHSDANITIADPKVSRKHGAFIIYPDSIVLEDYQSTNGCFVDGDRIERQIIESTARICVGNTCMKIEYKKACEVKAEKSLYRAANTDPLTNIPNRRAFLIRAQEEFSFCKRNGSDVSVIMCDVDHFKRINDSFGHPAGDQVLKDLAEILNVQLRNEDMLARYGGEEFIILLRATAMDPAVRWAERIRQQVEQFNFTFQNKTIPVTLSLGICCRNGKNLASLEEVIQEADDALYLAKNKGRNRIERI